MLYWLFVKACWNISLESIVKIRIRKYVYVLDLLFVPRSILHPLSALFLVQGDGPVWTVTMAFLGWVLASRWVLLPRDVDISKEGRGVSLRCLVLSELSLSAKLLPKHGCILLPRAPAPRGMAFQTAPSSVNHSLLLPLSPRVAMVPRSGQPQVL